MPRDGLSQYAPPPGTNGITNYTIESTKYNGFVADVTQDLNLPRPIVAGGTGANNAHDAMIALSGEIAKQGPVDNYATFPFVAGSFYSVPGATDAPDGATSTKYWQGISYTDASGIGVYLEARDASIAGIGARYVRHRSGIAPGTWSAWALQPGSSSDLDAAYVNVAGDQMTGNLNIKAPVAFNTWPLVVQAGADTNIGFVSGGANIAQLGAINDAGTTWKKIAIPSTVEVGAMLSAVTVTSGFSTAVGSYYFGNSGTAYFNYDGTNYRLRGGVSLGYSGAAMYLNADSGAATAVGTYHFNGSGTKYITYNGGAFVLEGAGTVTKSLLANDISSSLAANPANGSYYFGNVGAAHLDYDGTFRMTGGAFYVTNSTIMAGAGGATGIVSLGSSGVNYITNAGGNSVQHVVNSVISHSINQNATIIGYGNADSHTGNLTIESGSAGNGGSLLRWNKNSAQTWLLGHHSAIYGAGGSGSHLVLYNTAIGSAFLWDFSNNALTVGSSLTYKPGGGAWQDNSDARIKNVLGDYSRGLAEIVALHPVYYTFKGNDTPAPPAHAKIALEADAKLADVPVAVPYPNSPHKTSAEAATKFAGLIAQEVEAVIPEMVTKRSAYIDGAAVDDLRDLDTTPLIFALINAVKELKAEVDALKAAR